jgi:hypothetical protein
MERAHEKSTYIQMGRTVVLKWRQGIASGNLRGGHVKLKDDA